MTNYNDQYAQGQTSEQPSDASSYPPNFQASTDANYAQVNYEQQVPPNAPYTTNVYVSAQSVPQAAGEVLYPMTDSDRILRLVAFILSLISTISCAILVLPLAWMIPMTVISYKIYKGTKPNTVAFGVCTLLFLNFISGILLLCSTKNGS